MNGKRIMVSVAVFIGLSLFGGFQGAFCEERPYRTVTNYPNPFDSRRQLTTILYTVPEEGEVQVTIYDVFGNIVREFPFTKETAGQKRIVWDGTNDAGEKVAKGGYICMVEISGNAVQGKELRKIGVIH